jgi:2,3-bisphosphoglycerate-dependent phosphoglycerate mutase
MELVLVRHGEPEWVRDGLNVDNPPLTKRGEQQAEAMAETLRQEHFDEVYCSPLLRTRQTAAPLFAALNRKEVIDPWLEEIRNPIWHGTPQEKADLAYAEDRARPAEERWLGLDGGEHVGEFVARIHVGASEFLANRSLVRSSQQLAVWDGAASDKRIAIVAHAGTNSVFICHLLGLEPTPWEWERFVIGHASISRVQSMTLGDGVTFCLTKLSDVEHLPKGDRTQ